MLTKRNEARLNHCRSPRATQPESINWRNRGLAQWLVYCLHYFYLAPLALRILQNFEQKSEKSFTKFCSHFEIGAVQRIANLVGLEKCCKMRNWVQKSASMQKRTSPLKFGDLAEKSGFNSVSNLSTKPRARCPGSRRTRPALPSPSPAGRASPWARCDRW